MKKILVPTDLSILGDYAYGIAEKIAQASDAEIILLSVISAPPNALYSQSGVLIEDGEIDLTLLKQQQQELQNKLNKIAAKKVSVTKQVARIGNINQAILHFTENEKIDLIVMGTTGNQNEGLLAKQSHAAFLINHASTPIITLKCDREDLNLDKIVFVSDFTEAKNYKLEVLKNIQAIFNSKLILLKILAKKEQEKQVKIFSTIALFIQKNELSNYEIALYQDESVENGVAKFCAEKKIDLIALGTHQRSGFSKFFKHSVSDDIVNNLLHPILTFPITH